VKQQVTLAHRAAQNHLYGIHTTGVVFRDAHHLLVLGESQFKQLRRVQGGLIADGQPAADMPVKGGAPFPQFFLIHIIHLPE
jgi:hypothetical protein